MLYPNACEAATMRQAAGLGIAFLHHKFYLEFSL